MQVNNVRVALDVSYPGIEITNNGRFVRVATDYGLVVENDGEWTSIVKIPDSFHGKVHGLCADADGNSANDLTTKGGVNVNGQDNVYTLVGDSYQVMENIT